MKKTIVLSALILAVIYPPQALYAETAYYVQSATAKVMSGATFKSTVLGEVGRGYKFLSSGKEGAWVKVTYNNQDGYVPSLVLLTHPPLNEATVFTGDAQEMRTGFHRRASEISALSTDSRKGPDRDKQADYESLEKIELFTMSSREVKRFMEGR
jgi:uncharacterized protein YgiM (DUF1202 family)